MNLKSAVARGLLVAAASGGCSCMGNKATSGPTPANPKASTFDSVGTLSAKHHSPDPSLFLTSALTAHIANGTWLSAYGTDDLYSLNASERGVVPNVAGMQGGMACTTTIWIQPAKTSGRLQATDVTGSTNGLVVARLVNQNPACVPTSTLYSVVGSGGSAGVVAEPKGAGMDVVVATFAAYGSVSTANMSFQFCNHMHNGQTDKAVYQQVDLTAGKLCDQLNGIPRFDDAGEAEIGHGPFVFPRRSQTTEVFWIGCSDDCCPASQ